MNEEALLLNDPAHGAMVCIDAALRELDYAVKSIELDRERSAGLQLEYAMGLLAEARRYVLNM